MSDFDPYHKWLGISETARPVSKYRLLAIDEFESDRDVISTAAERQTVFLRTLQAGEHAVLVAELLNEVSQARVTLLNADQKAAYDEELRQQQAPEPEPDPIPVVLTPAPTPVVVRGTVTQEFPLSVVQLAMSPRKRKPHQIWKRPAVIGVSLVGVIGVLALLMNYSSLSAFITRPHDGDLLTDGDSNSSDPISAEMLVETAAAEKAAADKAAMDKATAGKAAAEKSAKITAALAQGDWETVLALDPGNIEGLRLQVAAVEKDAAVINNVFTKQAQWIDPTNDQFQPTRDARLSITHVWLDTQQSEQPILNIVIKIENRNKSIELSLQRQYANQNAANRTNELSPYIPLIRLTTGDGQALGSQAELVNRTIPMASEISETYQIALTVEQTAELDQLRVAVPKAWFNKLGLGYWGFEIPQVMITSTKPTKPPVQIARDRITNTIGMKLNLIPSGSFLMGSPEGEEGREDNETQHRVTISKAFYMQTTEVTQGQWEAVMYTKPWKGQEYSKYVKEGANYPAMYISWDDAVAYCKKLSEKEGKTYRLPTEAEWEYACRAGTQTTWSFGNDEKELGDYAWYGKNAWDIGERYAHQVGLKKPNAFGLHDMHGNVREWCHDYCGEDYYKQSPEKDPAGPSSGSNRVMRSGSWLRGSSLSRSARRYRHRLGDPGRCGFRLVRELD